MPKKPVHGSNSKRTKNNLKVTSKMKKIMLKPEFIKKLKKIDKEKGIPFKNINELREIIEGNNR